MINDIRLHIDDRFIPGKDIGARLMVCRWNEAACVLVKERDSNTVRISRTTASAYRLGLNDIYFHCIPNVVIGFDEFNNHYNMSLLFANMTLDEVVNRVKLGHLLPCAIDEAMAILL